MTISEKRLKPEELNVDTSDIVYPRNKETDIYRDIFKFLLQDVKNWVLQQNQSEVKKIDTSFKMRELVNWLLENNYEFIKRYAGSKETKSYRAHTNTPVVAKRVDKLVELRLLEKSSVKVESLRNKELETYLYDVTNIGKMVTLTTGIQNKTINQYSAEGGIILKFLLDEWLHYLPANYRSPENYYYNFLTEMMTNCIGKYEDIITNFIDLFQEHYNGYDINFSDLRTKTNFLLYSKMIIDSDFKILFYKILYEHHVSYLMNLLLDEPLARQVMAPKIQLIKQQFKIDVENIIERICSEYLKYNPPRMRLSKWQERNKKSKLDLRNLSKSEIEKIDLEEVILDFDIKNNWEEERNKNISNFDKITAMMECPYCYSIYPLSFEIENKLISDIICIHCKKSSIMPYHLRN